MIRAMTVPHWRRRPATITAETDAAVIGAGVTGLSAALAFQRAGTSVLLLERHAVASGASGRNAGFLMRGAADNYAAAVRTLGRERARALWRLTERNLADLRGEGIESLPSYRRIPSCIVATEPTEAAELRESADLMGADGFEVDLITTGADALWRSSVAQVGLVNPADGACNPHDLLALLRAKLAMPVREHCEVFAIEEREDHVLVHCAEGAIRARHAIVCTNAYTDLLFPDLSGHIVPNRGQMLALGASGRMLDCSYYLNHGADYIRQPDDSTIVIGGRRKLRELDERTRDDATTAPIQEALEDLAARILGERLPVTARWSGAMAFTPTDLPYVGPLLPSSPASRLWLCAGFNGHGMSTAFRTAKLTVAWMLGDEAAAAELAPTITAPPPAPDAS